MRAPWSLFVLLLAGLSTASAQTVREIQSSRGAVRISVMTLEAASPENGSTDSAHDDSAATPETPPIETINDFTSLVEMARSGEAILEVYFLDRWTGRELRFPLKYSELRRYLRSHPLRYQDGTPEERMVALFGDMAGNLRIRMKEPSPEKGK